MAEKLTMNLNDFGAFLETPSGQEFQEELLKSKKPEFIRPLAECKFVPPKILKEIVKKFQKQEWPDIFNNVNYEVLILIAKNPQADGECLEDVLRYAIAQLDQTPTNTKEYINLIVLIKTVLKNAYINDELLITVAETCGNIEVNELATKEIIKRYRKLISQKSKQGLK